MVATTNQSLAEHIRAQLQWDSRVESLGIDVNVSDRAATLTGTVPNYRSKRAAEEDAWMVGGLREVTNQIEVQRPSNSPASADSDIDLRIKNAIAWEPAIDAGKIDVMVSGGVVTLRGSVDAYWKKFQVEDDAYFVPGVVMVINEVAIVPTDRVEDEVIARDIEAAFDRNAIINPDDITVEVNQGTVTLGGNVSSRAEWHAAYTTAMYTGGVTDVVDRLDIRYV